MRTRLLVVLIVGLVIAASALSSSAAAADNLPPGAASCRLHASGVFPDDGSPAALTVWASACSTGPVVDGSGGGTGTISIAAGAGIGVAGEPAATALSVDLSVADPLGHIRQLSLSFAGNALFISLLAPPAPLPQQGEWVGQLLSGPNQGTGAAAFAMSCLGFACTIDGSFAVT